MVRNLLLIMAVAVVPFCVGTAGATLVKKKGNDGGPQTGGIDIGVAKGRVRVQCWQDGEKIIDETDLNVISLSLASQMNALRFRRAGGPETTLSIVSQNRTSCLLGPTE